MRYLILAIAILAHSLGNTQGAISLSIDVSADTILMANAFRLQYVIKNGEVRRFENPELKHFQLLQGPSKSSKISFINGARTSEVVFTYFFKPNKTGKFEIPAFEMEIEGEVYTSNRPSIFVVDNPDGLHQDPVSGQIEGRPLNVQKTARRKRFKI